jgi:hypothetical protein
MSLQQTLSLPQATLRVARCEGTMAVSTTLLSLHVQKTHKIESEEALIFPVKSLTASFLGRGEKDGFSCSPSLTASSRLQTWEPEALRHCPWC